MKLNEDFDTKETPSSLEELTKEELAALSTKLFLSLALASEAGTMTGGITYAGAKFIRVCESPYLTKAIESSAQCALTAMLPLYHKRLTDNE